MEQNLSLTFFKSNLILYECTLWNAFQSAIIVLRLKRSCRSWGTFPNEILDRLTLLRQLPLQESKKQRTVQSWSGRGTENQPYVSYKHQAIQFFLLQSFDISFCMFRYFQW